MGSINIFKPIYVYGFKGACYLASQESEAKGPTTEYGEPNHQVMGSNLEAFE